jgi:hypothetical protein
MQQDLGGSPRLSWLQAVFLSRVDEEKGEKEGSPSFERLALARAVGEELETKTGGVFWYGDFSGCISF